MCSWRATLEPVHQASTSPTSETMGKRAKQETRRKVSLLFLLRGTIRSCQYVPSEVCSQIFFSILQSCPNIHDQRRNPERKRKTQPHFPPLITLPRPLQHVTSLPKSEHRKKTSIPSHERPQLPASQPISLHPQSPSSKPASSVDWLLVGFELGEPERGKKIGKDLCVRGDTSARPFDRTKKNGKENPCRSSSSRW